jgi:hypothetical protein
VSNLPFLAGQDLQAVRDVLRVGLDEAALPTLTILNAVFYGVAEGAILAAYPTAATETDATRVGHLRNAAVFFTAANLAAGLALPEQETLGAYRYQVAAVDWEQRAADLRARGWSELAAVTGQAVVPRLFTVACGRRG